MHGAIDIDNVENVGEKTSGSGGRKEKKSEERHKSASGEWGEQLRWPLSCPFHLFGNIISTNQGRAKENGPA